MSVSVFVKPFLLQNGKNNLVDLGMDLELMST